MKKEDFLAQLPELVRSYRPAPEVVNQIKNATLLMIIGPSGAGKTSVIKQSGLAYVPPDTTRAPRAGEVDGKDYYFLKDFDRVLEDIKQGEFLQIAVGPAGDLYATKASSYPTGGIGVMTVMADVIPLFRQLGFKDTHSMFIAPPSYDEWMRRLNDHSSNKSQLAGRLNEAIRSFSFVLSDNQTHFILNEDIPKATRQVLDLLNGKVDQARELFARQASTDILNRIK